MTCPECVKGNCQNCVDRLRLIYRDDRICTCQKSDHGDAMQGEARRVQVQDPMTGDVYGPGLKVTQDGDVSQL